MRSSSIATVLCVLGALPLGAQREPLAVLRHAPSDSATPGSVITVMFDRPVAGALDRSVEARRIFRLEPAVKGTIAWRDPVTVRFVPDDPLPPGSRYTVTVDTTFAAIDGSRLTRPYHFRFRVPGPAILMTRPDWPRRARELAPGEPITVLYSAPVDSAALARSARLELPGCGDRAVVRLIPSAQRAVQESDGWEFNSAGGWDRDTIGDRFRRIVELRPPVALPEGCAARLKLPSFDPARPGDEWTFQVPTLPPFTLSSFYCPPINGAGCPVENLAVHFSAPVRGAEVARHVHVSPAAPLATGDQEVSDSWVFRVQLTPRTRYTVRADTALRDVYGRSLLGRREVSMTTGDRVAAISHQTGMLTLLRSAPRVIRVRHVNVDSIAMYVFPIDDSLIASLVAAPAWRRPDLVPMLRDTIRQVLAVHAPFNAEGIADLPLPAAVGAPGKPQFFAVRLLVQRRTPVPPTAEDSARGLPKGGLMPLVVTASSAPSPAGEILVQLSDLAAHAKVSADGGAVLVTDLRTGAPLRGATVVMHDRNRTIARGMSDALGVATLARVGAAPTREAGRRPIVRDPYLERALFLEVMRGADRLIVPITPATYSSDGRSLQLELGRLGAYGQMPEDLRAALITDRGIYRPGEMLYLKAVVRVGALGALEAPPGDSIRLALTRAGDDGADTVWRAKRPLSPFGTTADSVRLAGNAALGWYRLSAEVGRRGAWRNASMVTVQVAEYRAPEFQVELVGDSAVRYAGDTVSATVRARFLFGAPMGHAAMRWNADLRELEQWELHIPGADDYVIGESRWREGDATPVVPPPLSGVDTLDANGTFMLRVAPSTEGVTRPARLALNVAVIDVNRRAVTATTTSTLHPASLYLAAKRAEGVWWWQAGSSQAIQLLAVRPDGQRVAGIPIRIVVLRHRWQYTVERQPNGYQGRWISDTVEQTTVTSAAAPVAVHFTPRDGGWHEARLIASDDRGRATVTSLEGYVIGGAWAAWGGDNPVRLPLAVGRSRLNVGDTAVVAFTSPFADAEAWVTLEREGILEQRRLRVGSGVTTVRFAIGERCTPNVWIGVLLVRRGVRLPNGADSTAALLRAGYAELKIDPAAKRLMVELTAAPAGMEHYLPGDSATIRVRVREQTKPSSGARSEVALWAVDEGALSLTAFETPDLVTLFYRDAGIGLALRSSFLSLPWTLPASVERRLATVRLRGQSRLAAAVVVTSMDSTRISPERAAAAPPALRSDFRTTAFFLATLTTDDSGAVTARVKLPDNITTFRLIAVATTTGDRYGSAATSLLVTRPLVARPSLPRFVRGGDDFYAGAVINARSGTADSVHVTADVTGVTLQGERHQDARLEPGRGAELRFRYRVPDSLLHGTADSAAFRFDVAANAGADAVRVRLPVKPAFRTRVHTVAGVVRDSAALHLELPADIDPARSHLTLHVGLTPLAAMRSSYEYLRAYPYYCTEQLASAGRALLALYRVQRTLGVTSPGDSLVRGDALGDVQIAADELVKRQRDDGAIAYWRDHRWSSPWLSAYAGLFLVEAREAGAKVAPDPLRKLAGYLRSQLHDTAWSVDTITGSRADRTMRMRRWLGERLAAAQLLRRVGAADEREEDRLSLLVSRMAWEDRVWLAELLERRKTPTSAATARTLLADAWHSTTRAGRRIDLPDSAVGAHDFVSHVRPAARLLTATLRLEPEHPLIGALVETIVQQGRAERTWAWNTQDYASAIVAIAELTAGQRPSSEGSESEIEVRQGARTILTVGGSRSESVDSVAALMGLLHPVSRGDSGAVALPLVLALRGGTAPRYYSLSVDEVPVRRPTRPDIEGIVVERWYERFHDGTPITSVREGDLVRVRLRVTVPSDRQFVAVDDALPAGLEAVDLSLRTSSTLGPFIDIENPELSHARGEESAGPIAQRLFYGSWDSGWWSPWDHKEMRDDRVLYFARVLWKGTYTASYVARATTAGSFVKPPAHAEEMYNPALYGRSDGGVFTVERRAP